MADPALEPLNSLVGEWTVEGNPFDPSVSVRGTTTFEWLDGGAFLVQRWSVENDGSSWEHDFDLTYTKVGWTGPRRRKAAWLRTGPADTLDRWLGTRPSIRS